MNSGHTYVGFSTLGRKTSRRRHWKLYDRELVEQDLINLFNTRIGERIGRPLLGCRIWDIWFSQPTADTPEFLEQEIRRCCKTDKRIIVDAVQVAQVDRGFTIFLTLRTTDGSSAWDFAVAFDERQQMATRG